jgi:hypothetical protein
MITLEKPHFVRRSNIENEGVSFGIKKEGLAHIFNVLRNQLYSNKILAVVREYSCNAFDAHVAAGNSEKFVVSCPTVENPFFSVRDFGTGLSPSEISEVYAFYGESTKRQSNEMIGQLGLGSKSGFAYGDNFVIKSYYEGTLFIYNAFIDETKIGQIVLMDEQITDENNGVEIVIPVKLKDLFAFKENILTFFKYFNNKPIIQNIPTSDLQEAWKSKDIVLGGEGWQFLRQENSWDKIPSRMVMGNVAYPLEAGSVDGLDPIFCTNFIVQFEIGELEVAASRESLQFSSTTQTAIKKRFKKIRLEVQDKIREKVNAAKTLFDAKSIYARVTNSNGDFSRFKSSFQNLLWNNKVISDASLLIPNGITYKMYEIVKSARSERVVCRELKERGIHCYSWSRFYVDDTNHKFMQRLAHYVFNAKTTQIQKIYVIRFFNEASKQAFLTSTGVEESELQYVSKEKVCKIVYPKDESGNSCGPKDPKHEALEFTLDLNFSDRWCKVKSNQFKQTSFNLEDGGVYIFINRFFCSPKYIRGEECSIEALNFVRLLNFKDSEFGIEFPKQVACFKDETCLKASLNPKWQNISEYIKKWIQANWKNKQLQKIVNFLEYQKFMHEHSTCFSFIQRIENIPTIKDFVSLVRSFVPFKDKDSSENLINLFKNTHLLASITEGVEPEANLAAQMKDIYNKYPLLHAVNLWHIENAKTVEKYLMLQEKNLTAI